jgi:hypothetical protein
MAALLQTTSGALRNADIIARADCGVQAPLNRQAAGGQTEILCYWQDRKGRQSCGSDIAAAALMLSTARPHLSGACLDHTEAAPPRAVGD